MAMSTNRIDSHDPTPIQPEQIDCNIEFPLLVVTDVKPKHCIIQVFRYVASYYTYKSAILNVISGYIQVIHVNEPSSSNVNLEEYIFTNNLSSADIKAVSTKLDKAPTLCQHWWSQITITRSLSLSTIFFGAIEVICIGTGQSTYAMSTLATLSHSSI